jgi:hypothetical protein
MHFVHLSWVSDSSFYDDFVGTDWNWPPLVISVYTFLILIISFMITSVLLTDSNYSPTKVYLICLLNQNWQFIIVSFIGWLQKAFGKCYAHLLYVSNPITVFAC